MKQVTLVCFGGQYFYYSTLGFISGLPYVLFSDTLQAWSVHEGASQLWVALMVYLTLPYTLKPLSAWCLEVARSSGWCDYQGCMRACVAGLVGVLLAIATLPVGSFWSRFALAAIGCGLSSVYDNAADATRLLATRSTELQARLSTWFVAGYRFSWVVGGGAALVWADLFGWQKVYGGLAGLVALAWLLVEVVQALVHLALPKDRRLEGGEDAVDQATPSAVCDETGKVLLNDATASYEDSQSAAVATNFGAVHFFKQWWAWCQRPNTLRVLCFCMLLKFHESLVKPLLMLYLQKGAGLGLSEIGIWYKTVGLWATLLGGAVCGGLFKRFSHIRVLQWVAVLECIGSVLFLFGSMQRPEGGWVLYGAIDVLRVGWLIHPLSIAVECLAFGAVTAAVMAILVTECDEQMASMQYASMVSVLLLEKVLLAPVGITMLELAGWSGFWGLGLGCAGFAVWAVAKVPKWCARVERGLQGSMPLAKSVL